MTARVTVTCDYCNPEAKTDTEFPEHTGLAVVMYGEWPTGWWDVPGKGRDGKIGHACPHCIMEVEGVADDIIQRRDAETREILEKTGGAKPPRDQAAADSFNEHYGLEGDARVGPGHVIR